MKVGGKRTLKIGDLMGTVVIPFMKLETDEDRAKLVELVPLPLTLHSCAGGFAAASIA